MTANQAQRTPGPWIEWIVEPPWTDTTKYGESTTRRIYERGTDRLIAVGCSPDNAAEICRNHWAVKRIIQQQVAMGEEVNGEDLIHKVFSYCNSHDALVAALRESILVAALHIQGTADGDPLLTSWRAALAAATGE